MCNPVRPFGPGPGAYLLPPLVGYHQHDVRKLRAAEYSFGLRENLKDSVVSPGPAAYQLDRHLTRHGRIHSPEYSMGLRAFLKDRSIGPGPGAYDIEKCKNFRGHVAPAYSMAPRNFKDKLNLNPGPNAYYGDIRCIKPGVPAFSFGKRTFLKPKLVSPGPAAYNPPGRCINSICPPQYTIVAKRSPLKNITTIPGPNNYNLQGKTLGRRSPAYSFGVRHNCYAPPMIVPLDNC